MLAMGEWETFWHSLGSAITLGRRLSLLRKETTMDVFGVPCLQLMDILVTAVGLLAFLGLAGSASDALPRASKGPSAGILQPSPGPRPALST